MKKEKITEKMNLQKEWFEEAREVELKDLDRFIEKMNGFEHDYGTMCHATVAVILASAWSMAKENGITGFQAGLIMLVFLREWKFRNNYAGLKIVDYDNMLYPQYEDKFEKIITKETFEALQKQAAERLEKASDNVNLEVMAHWRDIVNGKIPFGYEVEVKGSDE